MKEIERKNYSGNRAPAVILINILISTNVNLFNVIRV